MISALVVVTDLMSIRTETSTLLKDIQTRRVLIRNTGLLDYRERRTLSGTIQGLSELSCQDIFERPTGIAGGLVPLLDRIRPTLGQIFWRLDWLFGDGIPDGWGSAYGLDPIMPVTQSLILTTTAGIWIEMVSSYQIHLLRPLLGRGV